MKIHKDLARSILVVVEIVFLIAGVVQASDQVMVQRVIDGDTLKVIYQGQKESVRLIGIDAPESRTNKKALKDSNRTGQDMQAIISMGKEATNYVKGIIKPSDIINIELARNDEDILTYALFPNVAKEFLTKKYHK